MTVLRAPFIEELWPAIHGSWVSDDRDGVVRVDDGALNSVVFVYPDEPGAVADDPLGGTGFLLWVPAGPDRQASVPLNHIYVVTNSHVIREREAPYKKRSRPVIAVRQVAGGKPRLIPVPARNWQHHRSADLAIAPLELDESRDLMGGVHVARLVTPARLLPDDENIGVGDEVYSLTRFQPPGVGSTVILQGGLISAPPLTLPHTRHLGNVLTFLVEAHSRGGASGSPVFAVTQRNKVRPGHTMIALEPTDKWMLGVTFGHTTEWQDGRIEVGPTLSGSPIDVRVHLNEEIVCVTPAWFVEELVDSPRLRADRVAEEAAIETAARESRLALDSAESPERPFTRDEMMSALASIKKRPSKPPSQSGSEG